MILPVDPQTMDLLKTGVYIGIGIMIVRKLGQDVNGLGKRTRSDAEKNAQLWKEEIASEIEELEPPAKAKRIANRLRKL